MNFAGREINFDTPKVMGVLNVTPDSFSDGGRFYSAKKLDLDKALFAAEKMVNEGAAFIDIGGESTRPGAARVSVDEEAARVLPVIEKLADNLDVVISVDTSSPVIIRQAASLGAGLVNDVRALTRDGAMVAAIDAQLPVCFMHMQGTPQTMQMNPRYSEAVNEVYAYLQQRVEVFLRAGGHKENIIVDPGFGFGKTDEHNMDLLNSLAHFSALGVPILVGLSRKSMIGRLLNRKVDERLAASLALAIAAVKRGANIIRVHDVQATIDAITMTLLVGENIDGP